MAHYIEDSDFRSEYDNLFNDLYDIGGVRKIKELSRQLRTFFNYKTEVIRYRFRSNSISLENETTTKFLTQKQNVESLSHEFITLLKKVKKHGQTLEEGIRSLYYENNKSQINKLSALTEKLSILIHIFSEESIYDHPRFLKFIVVLVKNICLVKKCLHAQFSEFYGELEINYNNLEGELESLLEKTPSVKTKKPKKQHEGRLTS
jgi:hypothetical protein